MNILSNSQFKGYVQCLSQWTSWNTFLLQVQTSMLAAAVWFYPSTITTTWRVAASISTSTNDVDDLLQLFISSYLHIVMLIYLKYSVYTLFIASPWDERMSALWRLNLHQGSSHREVFPAQCRPLLPWELSWCFHWMCKVFGYDLVLYG